MVLVNPICLVKAFFTLSRVCSCGFSPSVVISTFGSFCHLIGILFPKATGSKLLSTLPPQCKNCVFRPLVTTIAIRRIGFTNKIIFCSFWLKGNQTSSWSLHPFGNTLLFLPFILKWAGGRLPFQMGILGRVQLPVWPFTSSFSWLCPKQSRGWWSRNSWILKTLLQKKLQHAASVRQVLVQTVASSLEPQSWWLVRMVGTYSNL